MMDAMHSETVAYLITKYFNKDYVTEIYSMYWNTNIRFFKIKTSSTSKKKLSLRTRSC